MINCDIVIQRIGFVLLGARIADPFMSAQHVDCSVQPPAYNRLIAILAEKSVEAARSRHRPSGQAAGDTRALLLLASISAGHLTTAASLPFYPRLNHVGLVVFFLLFKPRWRLNVKTAIIPHNARREVSAVSKLWCWTPFFFTRPRDYRRRDGRTHLRRRGYRWSA